MFDHIVAADSVLWPLLVLVSIWVFAFLGGLLGALSANRPQEPHDAVPVLLGAEQIVERR